MASVVRLNSPWDDVPFPAIPGLLGPQTTRQADQWSVASWMDLNLSDDPATQDAKTLLRNAFTGVFGVDTGAVSLLQLLFFIQSFDGNFLNATGSGPGQAEQFRVAAPGAQQMALLIADRLGRDAVRLNAAVRTIQQDGSGVRVATSDLTVSARRAIVAVPTTLNGFIRYDPILPPDRAQLSPTIRCLAIPPQNPAPDNYFEFKLVHRRVRPRGLRRRPRAGRLDRRRVWARPAHTVWAHPLGERGLGDLPLRVVQRGHAV